MSTDTPARPAAQAPSTHRRRRFPDIEPLPIDPATRMRRIRIARAVCLIARTKCNCTMAARAVGLGDDRKAIERIRELLPRRGYDLHRIRTPETPSRNFETFILRQDAKFTSHLPPSRTIAEVVAELIAVADPFGDDVPRDDRAKDADRHVLEQDAQVHDVPDKNATAPRPPRICVSCGDAFEGNRGAKFCGVRSFAA
jgi:hypothetical protein